MMKPTLSVIALKTKRMLCQLFLLTDYDRNFKLLDDRKEGASLRKKYRCRRDRKVAVPY